MIDRLLGVLVGGLLAVLLGLTLGQVRISYGCHLYYWADEGGLLHPAGPEVPTEPGEYVCAAAPFEVQP